MIWATGRPLLQFPNRSMISIVIPTRESERVLVRTLAGLVPGATAGLVREVILADAGSQDETAAIGDVAGCRLMVVPGPPGPRLKNAAEAAKGPWLLFVPAGSVLETGWIEDVRQFMETAPSGHAAVFGATRPVQGGTSLWSELLALLRARKAVLDPDRGLLIAKEFYTVLGGHRDIEATQADLLRRIGAKRIAVMRSGIRNPA